MTASCSTTWSLIETKHLIFINFRNQKQKRSLSDAFSHSKSLLSFSLQKVIKTFKQRQARNHETTVANNYWYITEKTIPICSMPRKVETVLACCFESSNSSKHKLTHEHQHFQIYKKIWEKVCWDIYSKTKSGVPATSTTFRFKYVMPTNHTPFQMLG